jgi:hypothetical protein
VNSLETSFPALLKVFSELAAGNPYLRIYHSEQTARLRLERPPYPTTVDLELRKDAAPRLKTSKRGGSLRRERSEETTWIQLETSLDGLEEATVARIRAHAILREMSTYLYAQAALPPSLR